jgi:hypothetical protein
LRVEQIWRLITVFSSPIGNGALDPLPRVGGQKSDVSEEVAECLVDGGERSLDIRGEDKDRTFAALTTVDGDEGTKRSARVAQIIIRPAGCSSTPPDLDRLAQTLEPYIPVDIGSCITRRSALLSRCAHGLGQPLSA